MRLRRLPVFLALLLILAPCFAADPPQPDTSRGDRMIAAYFEAETAKLRDRCLAEVQSLDDWKAKRAEYRRQLLEMLGLAPLPERTDLKATITGRVERDDFAVEKLHFQSQPGLYVTGNLYLPKEQDGPVPGILYVCGHGAVKKDGVSYGNKVHYHHHGVWFARHGYVCLAIDSLQLGEIESIHHGTYRYGMWWWNNRGYTPAGVEAWNCTRALDYLQSRKEVDPERLGVTGRSGGGAYSWWIASIDERIKTAVPVAGITDLENHVVDGCVEGHCDCMFFVNTYRWDYPLVAALVAPRPLMIGNSDADGIFPLDGVTRTYEKARRIYELYGAGDKITLNVTKGPHSDTPELRKPAFAWFDKHLRGVDRPIDPAEKCLQPEELKVFAELPEDERNTTIHETFVPAAPPPQVPSSAQEWAAMRDGWRKALTEKVFRGWPDEPEPLDVQEAFTAESEGVRLSACDFTSQGPVRLRLYRVASADVEEPALTVLGVLDAQGWEEFLSMMRVAFAEQLEGEAPVDQDGPLFEKLRGTLQSEKCAMVFVAPRGIGPTAWNPNDRKQTQIRRRFMLLGQTLDGMRVWDVRRAVQAVRSLEGDKPGPIVLQGERQAAALAVYASLFEPDLKRLDLSEMPRTHRDGPILLNVRRFLDLPEAVAMAAERCEVMIYDGEGSAWQYPSAVAESLHWPDTAVSVADLPKD